MMNAQCPNCQAVYHIDDSKIPDKGAHAKCPKCQMQFSVKNEPDSQQGTTEVGEIVCPKCEHKQPMGVKCEKCGLIFAKYEARLTKDRAETGSEKLKREQDEAERRRDGLVIEEKESKKTSREEKAGKTPYTCSLCGKGISPNASFCSHCGEPSTEARPKSEKVKVKQLLGIAGSIVLFVGVFMPIVKFPIVGYVNYFHNGRGDGVIVLALALISAFLSLIHRYKGLWYTGFGSLLVLAFTLFLYLSKMSQIMKEMNVELEGNSFRGLADAALGSVQLQWGWAVLVVGAVLLVAAAAIRRQPEELQSGVRKLKTLSASATVQVKAIKNARTSMLKWAGIGIIIIIVAAYMIDLALERTDEIGRADEANVSVDSGISLTEDDEQLSLAYGFRGIKWGTSISALRDMVPYKEPSKFNVLGKLKDKAQYSWEHIWYLSRKLCGDVYTRKNDVLEIKHVSLKGIYYVFWLNKFYGVNIEFYPRDYEDILDIYQDRYGEFSFVTKGTEKKEYDDFEIIIQGFSTEKLGELCQINYWYKPILNKRNEDTSRYYKNKEEKKKKLREVF